MIESFIRFLRCRSGVASIEFMAVIPVMIVIMFASVEVWSQISVRGRLTDAAATLADMVSVSSGTIDSIQMQSLFEATEVILRGDGSRAQIQVYVLGINPDYCNPSNGNTCPPNSDPDNEIVVRWGQRRRVGGSDIILRCQIYDWDATSGDIVDVFGSGVVQNMIDLSQEMVVAQIDTQYTPVLWGGSVPIDISRATFALVRNLSGVVDGPSGSDTC